jgi:SAM-dependent methyltransferase
LSTPAEQAARWGPLGRAILDYHRGATSARIVVHSNLWEDEVTAVEEFYRPDHLTLQELEVRAISLCRGKVLDLGAGAGRHALELQRLGHEVTALDVAPEAVEVMRERGVRDARSGDLDAVTGEVFDTILLLMHGIGLVGTLAGLNAFLKRAGPNLAQGGQIVCDSADLSLVMPSQWEAEKRRRDGHARYLGEVDFRLSYEGREGLPYPWLFVDPETLGRAADTAGFGCQVVARGARGAFLATLTCR